MMTREEVAEVITYCKENGISYKERLTELGIPIWKFYDSKARYAREQEASEAKGEFLQLSSGGTFFSTPSFAATSGKKIKGGSNSTASQMLSIELRTPNGTMMRIQAYLFGGVFWAIIWPFVQIGLDKANKKRQEIDNALRGFSVLPLRQTTEKFFISSKILI